MKQAYRVFWTEVSNYGGESGRIIKDREGVIICAEFKHFFGEWEKAAFEFKSVESVQVRRVEYIGDVLGIYQ